MKLTFEDYRNTMMQEAQHYHGLDKPSPEDSFEYLTIMEEILKGMKSTYRQWKKGRAWKEKRDTRKVMKAVKYTIRMLKKGKSVTI